MKKYNRHDFDQKKLDSFERAENIVEVICQHAISYPNQEAVILVMDSEDSQSISLSYSQLDVNARNIASWLQKHFSEGERILLLYPVGLNFVSAFLGCLYAGMVAVPAPLPGKFRHQQERIKTIARNANVVAMLTDSNNYNSLKMWMELENIEDIICSATDKIELIQSKAWVQPPISRNTLALLQYTSGSTGEPKGVMITHHNLLYNVSSFKRGLGFTRQTRFGSWVPLYHDMGLIAQLLPALFLGSTYVMMSPSSFLKRPYQWLQMIDKFKVNHTVAPNFAFDLCTRRVQDEQLAKLDISHLKYIINGSEPIQSVTIHDFAKRFAIAGLKIEAICPCYGMAEATVFISGFTPRVPVVKSVDSYLLQKNKFVLAKEDQVQRKLVSCGIPIDYDVKIVNPDTFEVLPVDTLGEIWLRGESISCGYWRNEQATNTVFKLTTAEGDRGYFRTGDIGVLHQGELYIAGRIKEIFIVNGRNVYPHDIEHEIRLNHPELKGRPSAVFNISTQNNEEAIVVTQEIQGVFTNDFLQILTIKIKETVLREFGIQISAVLLVQSGSVHRTTSGKIQRSTMRECFLAETLPIIYENISSPLNNLRQSLSSLKNKKNLDREESAI